MRPVQDESGTRYLLCKRSTDASLVRDPETGTEQYIQNDRLEPVEEASALETAARGVEEPVLTLLTTVHDAATLGLLIELADRGPLGVRTLLDAYECCESDLHGRLTLLSAAGLLEETEVAGERGYRLTDDCETALETIRPAATSPDTSD